MKLLGYFFAFLLVIALLTQETEARRKILKGRKTITRTYIGESALPAWAYVILIAIGELIAGGIIYFIMKKKILDREISGQYALADTIPH
ncbi:PREDICTED: uncharacterized protein LOC108559066 [Nicrophorus vespilloides]|uniref:Uncharacterized protein LOC108559066 n=1 Tax=Nicrophorus vespilloides TaxID=110193 RepID=A0ABM1MAT4_NICVS|nr:PREDICTED: uncharacterized protein LOC108559066 [Nicrophorus vespilloides]